MRKFSIVGCAYLLIFCMPLHLAASVGSQTRLSESSIVADYSITEEDIWEEIELIEDAEAEQFGLFGPGNRNKKRHKEKKKRMGGHKNLQERINQKGVFGKKKNSGVGQNVLFLVVPAVAVVGLAFLFAASTKDKNAKSLLDPTPDGTN
jgi:hypothetical protein